ncbi:phage Gp37/Gp68 family protein [Bradyrhizobium sp. INPA01-394B]|uniref:Phage Gp37/Gp68 family protein n=2 Tax=Bacteria TaxID=2 RepID=A0ABR7U025_9BRAD|nr:phage Gp37/Gp68 family protein [Bradyrhizobium campsiandrae]MBC9875971.1 phage Gp37/Gp68 family protein [Bradyrhizobium campsiandrae]MBC9976920.1 phage Gp37/Gp68 family protein [Bradyrhizobium campsiandrae]
MGENSAISWCDHTFNPWIGCTRVSPACDHCYAATENQRRKWVASWGEPGQSPAPRHRTKTWGNPLKWQRQHLQFYSIHQRPQRVFCASLADVFDNEVPAEWRADLFSLINRTPDLRWILLTKRIGNVLKMVPAGAWTRMPHVGLMSTIANQAEWDRDYPKLKAVPAAWHGISAEPLLGPINIGDARPDWIITGGESGTHARPMSIQWVRELRDQCAAGGIAFHFKQWGEWAPARLRASGSPGRFAFGDYEYDRTAMVQVDSYPRHFTMFGSRTVMERLGRSKTGDRLDGIEHKAFPPQLAA